MKTDCQGKGAGGYWRVWRRAGPEEVSTALILSPGPRRGAEDLGEPL